MSVGRRACAANSAIHRRNQHRRRAAQPGLGDIDLQIGLVRRLRFHVGLRPTVLGVVMPELQKR